MRKCIYSFNRYQKKYEIEEKYQSQENRISIFHNYDSCIKEKSLNINLYVFVFIFINYKFL